ncbi:type II toxin-antitoxin system VapC family toxin [Occultella kanbiaonis]|uniref:type II toxin-antitoxin system VapC family toxin n=1 Tax=Occultella kanbiaonis TaxID=2675754 RepID=UPI0012B88393|nr:type II toxin-antitoxin system VapC family toxin [Occultella kanbiaonis]
MIVLDTNVVSELVRANPEPSVVTWFERVADTDLAITAVTTAELHCGLARLPEGRRKLALATALGEVLTAYADALLPFTASASVFCGAIVSSRESIGRPIAVVDAQIAAICTDLGSTLATRNVRDFEGLDIELVDPWKPDTTAR